MDSVTASDLLNASSFDPARLHPMAGIGNKLDYLLLDDDKVNQLPGSGTALPSRGWSDDLCYGTGTTYLTGQNPKHTIYPRDLMPCFLFCSLLEPNFATSSS